MSEPRRLEGRPAGPDPNVGGVLQQLVPGQAGTAGVERVGAQSTGTQSTGAQSTGPRPAGARPAGTRPGWRRVGPALGHRVARSS